MIELIEDKKSFDKAVATLRGADILYVDTEFNRTTTYYPVPCLIQVKGGEPPLAISTPSEEAPSKEGEQKPSSTSYLFDIIKLGEAGADDTGLAALGEVLLDPKRIKVFHAGRQDLEILKKMFGVVPEPIFDTQIAAMALGHGEQIGFEPLVKALTKTKLDKDQQFVDWARRPLSDAQITYAANDVIYLESIYIMLKERLKKLGREAWIADEVAKLVQLSGTEIAPAEAWKRIKLRRANSEQQSILQALAEWREIEARAADRTKNRIASDDVLVDIAKRKPENINDMSRILKGKRVKDRYFNDLMSALQAGLDQKEAFAKDNPIEKTKIPEPDMRLDLLKLLLKARAQELKTHPRLIAAQEDLEGLLAGADTPLSTGWRYEVFGKDAAALASGTASVAMVDGTITLNYKS